MLTSKLPMIEKKAQFHRILTPPLLLIQKTNCKPPQSTEREGTGPMHLHGKPRNEGPPSFQIPSLQRDASTDVAPERNEK